MPLSMKGFFDNHEYRNCIYAIVEIKSYVVLQPHTLDLHAAICTEFKLTCINQVFFINEPFGCF
jgi:hypothetical protein